MEQPIVTTGFEETQEVATEFVSKLESGAVICLYGDLAAGKTTFTQGIGVSLGIDRIVSPTFIIMREYPVTSHPVIKRLYHLDLYRLNSSEDIRSFDLDEIWQDPQNLMVIEWPEKIADILPRPRYDINFVSTGEDQREISINHLK